MSFSPTDAIIGCTKLIAFAVTLQTIELLLIRKCFSDTGIWRWEILEKEFVGFPALSQKLLKMLMPYRVFLILLIIQLAAAISLLFYVQPVSLWLIFAITLVVCLRWRGTFNGGSDYMTVVVLSALCACSAFNQTPAAELAALWYISIQLCLSYFISGIAKLRRSSWRNGTALSSFLNSSIYGPPRIANRLAAKAFAMRIASWTIIIFECLFPLALFNHNTAAVFICAALLFHITNVYIFSLNRFLWAWAAAYPALYFCSQFGRM